MDAVRGVCRGVHSWRRSRELILCYSPHAVSRSVSLSPVPQTAGRLLSPPAAPEVAVRNVSLVPLCPPSLMVVWAPVEPSLLNGPAEESVYVIFWQERGGQGNGRAEVDYSDTTTVSPGILIPISRNSLLFLSPEWTGDWSECRHCLLSVSGSG